MAYVVLLGLSTSHCTNGPGIAPTPPPTRAPADCGPPIAGLDAALERSRFLVFGELHGTAEVPAFFGHAVCQAAVRGGRIRVGLEIPASEQGRLDAFVSSPSGDTAPLLAGEFWRREFQDGRSSAAILALLVSLRRMRRDGLDVVPLAYEPVPGTKRGDADLAEGLLSARALAPADRFMVLTGNLHARRDVGAPWDPKLEFTAHLIAQREPTLLTLNNAYLDGSAWTCSRPAKTVECGAHPVRGSTLGAEPGIRLLPDDPAQPSWDGTFAVGPVHASLPAVDAPR